jgi:Flp pilus assembly protein TadG
MPKAMRMKSFRQYLKSNRGVAAIEMGLVFPFMWFLFIGLIDVTDIVSKSRKITAIASSVADLAGQNRNNIVKTDIEDYFKVAKLIMNPQSDASVKVVVYGFRKSGATVSQTWKVDNGKGVACNKVPDISKMSALMEAANDLVVAQACTKYVPPYIDYLNVPYILGSADINLEQIITLRPRSSLKLDCYTDATLKNAC